jgi:hypothetical protein
VNLDIHDVQMEHFTARAEAAAPRIVVRLSGNADQLVRDPLHALLAELKREAAKWTAEEVVVDVRDLYFMNSSCLSVIVRWITGLPKTGGWHVRFVCNTNLRWQKRSLQAMATLGDGLVVIE